MNHSGVELFTRLSAASALQRRRLLSLGLYQKCVHVFLCAPRLHFCAKPKKTKTKTLSLRLTHLFGSGYFTKKKEGFTSASDEGHHGLMKREIKGATQGSADCLCACELGFWGQIGHWDCGSAISPSTNDGKRV